MRASSRICVRKAVSSQSLIQPINQSIDRSFSAFSRNKRPKRPKPVKVEEPVREPINEPVDQSAFRDPNRPKNAPPRVVSADEMLDYQDRSSMYSRLTLLTSRITSAFALLRDLTNNQSDNQSAKHSHAESVVEAINNVYRLNASMAPYNLVNRSPSNTDQFVYPAWAYHLCIKLLAKVNAEEAKYALYQYHEYNRSSDSTADKATSRSLNQTDEQSEIEPPPASFPLSPELCVVVAQALSAERRPSSINELIGHMENKWKLPLTIEICTAWLESVQPSDPSASESGSRPITVSDVLRARRSIAHSMAERHIPLSSRCYELMIEAMNLSKINEIKELLNHREQSISQSVVLSNEFVSITPGISGALKKALIENSVNSSMSHPSQYVPKMISLLGFDQFSNQSVSLIHALMSHYSNDPEHVHALFEQLVLESPADSAARSIKPTLESYSLLINSYANRSNHRVTSQSVIHVHDVIRIERLMSRMSDEGIDASQDVSIQLIALRIAAQRGDGDAVAHGVHRLIDQATKNPTIYIISSKSFLPVLNTLSSLSSPHRLEVLGHIHKIMHQSSLSCSFTFSVLTRTQAALGDVPALKATLAEMNRGHIDVNVHHYTHLFHAYAFARTQTGKQRMARAGLVLDAMKGGHVRSSPYLEAVHLIALAVNTSLEAAEARFRLLREFHHVEPHPYTRFALIDCYLHQGYVRHAARHYVKLMTGQKEKGTVVTSGNQVIYTLSDEEMRRMLQVLLKHGKGQSEQNVIKQMLGSIEQRRVSSLSQSVIPVHQTLVLPSDPSYHVELDHAMGQLMVKRAQVKAVGDQNTLLVDLRKTRHDELFGERDNSPDKRSLGRPINPLDDLQFAFLELMQRVAFDVDFVHMDVTQPNLAKAKNSVSQSSNNSVSQSSNNSASQSSSQSSAQSKANVSDMPFHAAVDTLNIGQLDYASYVSEFDPSMQLSNNQPQEDHTQRSNAEPAANQSDDEVTFDLDDEVQSSKSSSTHQSDDASTEEPIEQSKPVESADPLLQAAKRFLANRKKAKKSKASSSEVSKYQSVGLTHTEEADLNAFVSGADDLRFDDSVGKSRWQNEDDKEEE